ncbi:GH14409 [Drosophila grimshawi]|uniref:GH14409 n=1 Tax=Drosophila grimshawi TaxID=7222 RepID=B4J198_DROGR|nr:GH14409 [Drosophila grimshawi]
MTIPNTSLIVQWALRLANLQAAKLNNTAHAEREFILFNRLEKVGSQSMTRLLGHLSNLNGFHTFRNQIPDVKKPLFDFEEEVSFAEELQEIEDPAAYVEHTNWINFTAHDMPRPIYINLVRHPIQKVISAYYYARHPMIYANSLLRNPNKPVDNKEFFDRSFNECVRKRIAPYCNFDAHLNYNKDWRRFTLHLCGNQKVCLNFNSEEATQIAKLHVEKEYAVVGSWEHTNITLAVLEAYIPRFFADATNQYYLHQEKFRINVTPHDKHLDEDVEAYLNQQFSYEIDLYHFCMQRLYKQYIAIKKILQLDANKLNNTKKAEIDVLFFNRVPKTGSVHLITLMKSLGKIHDYDVDKDPQIGGIQAILQPDEEADWIENIANLEDGSVFASHVNYLNFSKYSQPRPIYINMVRDPVERVISWHYFIRAPWIFVPGRRRNNREMPNPKWANMEFDQCVESKEKVCTYIEGSLLERAGDHRRQTLFFCGHNEFKCTPFNSRLALQLAKENVEREYAVVGTWEHTNETLAVLEAYVPRYFADASKLYYSGLHAKKSNDNPMKPHIRKEIIDMVRRNFTREIEFYQFCRQRLHRQYLAIKLKDLMRMDESLVKLQTTNELAIRD